METESELAQEAYGELETHGRDLNEANEAGNLAKDSPSGHFWTTIPITITSTINRNRDGGRFRYTTPIAPLVRCSHPVSHQMNFYSRLMHLVRYHGI